VNFSKLNFNPDLSPNVKPSPNQKLYRRKCVTVCLSQYENILPHACTASVSMRECFDPITLAM